MMSQSGRQILNFGRNVQFRPQQVAAPRSEDELLDVINRSPGCIRAVGTKHAWSDGIKTDDTLIDMRHFNAIRVEGEGDALRVHVGAGCRIKHLLTVLNALDLTIPSVGVVTEQTLGGATATATHGSGKSSLSHYVQAVRVACAPNGTAEIREISGGDELRAARCSLGCLGIVVEVVLTVVPQYYVEETITACDHIDQVLAAESETPLQQVYLMPHEWRFYNQRRRVVESGKRNTLSIAYRCYWFWCVDLGLHVLLKLSVSVLRSRSLARAFYRHLVPTAMVTNWTVVDRSDRMLVTEHELFRHLETELFVRRSALGEATSFVIDVLKAADSNNHSIDEEHRRRLSDQQLLGSFESLRGTYTHHYPICFRRILPDDAMISMTSGSDEDWYSISFITYVQPRDRFLAVADFLATSMDRLFGARAHWGKWFPLDHLRIEENYPALSEFRTICEAYDPDGQFRNAFVRDALGFDQPRT